MKRPIFLNLRASILCSWIAATVFSHLNLYAVSNAVPPPAGLVSWWRAETNALDAAGTNNGSLAGNTVYGTGRVGQAFALDGLYDGVQLGNPVSLQLQDFTIETWIKRASTTQISQYNGGYSGGCLFSYGSGGYGFIMQNNGDLALSRIDIDHVLVGTTVTDTNWHHVAVTKSGNTVTIYVDGVASPVATYNTAFTFSTSVAIGARGDDLTSTFWGSIDELAVYNRALVAAEIQAIYNASSGKIVGPAGPYIYSQPAGQTVLIGDTASFGVIAGGTAPLSYQWTWNGTNLPGATNASLDLPNIQSGQSGNYSVTITNAVDTVVSSNALLTISSPQCIAATSNLVSWWPAEGNAADTWGANNGTLINGTGFTSGKVGQAFSFDGIDDCVGLPASASLNVGAGGGFTIEGWIKPVNIAAAESLGRSH
jgi:hypothetical protein